jgi:hypothetical protein
MQRIVQPLCGAAKGCHLRQRHVFCATAVIFFLRGFHVKAAFSHHLHLQFICYGFAVLLSGLWLALWLRLRLHSPDATRRVWSLIPWFTGLVLTSSVAGLAGTACFVYSKEKRLDYSSSVVIGRASAREQYMIIRESDEAFSSFVMLMGVETLLFGLAEIIIIKRLVDYVKDSLPAMKESSDVPMGMSRSSVIVLVRFFWAVSALVVCSGVAGIVTAGLAVQSYQKLGKLLQQAAYATDQLGQVTNSSNAFMTRLNESIPEVNFFTSQFVLNKSIVLLLITFSYIIIGPYCILLLRLARGHIETAMQRLKSLSNGSHTDDEPVYFSNALDTAVGMLQSPLQAAISRRRRLVIAFNVCFWTMLPRIAHDILYLIGNWDSARSLECGSCATCQSLYWLLSEWLWQTPEFLLVTFAISSTFPLALSLLLLISERENRLLFSCSPEARNVQDQSARAQDGIRDQFRVSFATGK